MNRFFRQKPAFALVLAVSLIPLLYLYAENLKEDSNFCLSCHLDSGKVMHGLKGDAMKSMPPSDLAGLHFAKSGGKDGCYACHQGRSFGISLKVHWREVANTARYFFASFKEPDKMSGKMMPDENCLACHQEVMNKSGDKSFHGFGGHKPMRYLACIDCHPAHQQGDPTYYQINVDRLFTACKTCHPNLSPFILSALPRRP